MRRSSMNVFSKILLIAFVFFKLFIQEIDIKFLKFLKTETTKSLNNATVAFEADDLVRLMCSVISFF